MLSNKRITKALIRLRGCAGWSAPLMFANTGRQGSFRRGPYAPKPPIPRNIIELNALPTGHCARRRCRRVPDASMHMYLHSLDNQASCFLMYSIEYSLFYLCCWYTLLQLWCRIRISEILAWDEKILILPMLSYPGCHLWTSYIGCSGTYAHGR